MEARAQRSPDKARRRRTSTRSVSPKESVNGESAPSVPSVYATAQGHLVSADPLSAALHYAARGFPVIPLHTPDAAGGCDCGRTGCDSVGKHPRTLHGLSDASTDPDALMRWWGMWPTANIGLVIPPGYVAVDVDGADGWAALEAHGLELPPTTRQRTGRERGEHLLYRTAVAIGPKVSVLPHVDLRGPGSYVVAAPSIHASGRRYQWTAGLDAIADAPAWLAELGERPRERVTAGEPIPAGRRNSTLASLGGMMRRQGFSESAIAAALRAENGRCIPPLRDDEVQAIARSVARYAPEPDPVLILPEREPDAEPAPALDSWPTPPAEAAYHGVLGDIAQAVAPFTEADPVGVLGTVVAMFGSACGGGCAFYQGSQQRTNLSLLLVGDTGFRGRKGTSLDLGRAVFRLAYPELETHWLVGAASGEALTGHYARELEEAQKAGRAYDERVLLVEPEFGRLLTIMGREGSTLSPVLRNAWDGAALGHARSRDESLVTNHHVTLLGHITPQELRAKLTDVDAANGFTNRILMLAVRRSHIIPFPEAPDRHVGAFIEPLRAAIEAARTPAELTFDAAGADRWAWFYAELATTPRMGLAGAVTGRHEAQVARLALVYALADRSRHIGEAHLEAAIALAEYARRSAVWALGDSTGNRHADVLLRMLADGPLGWKEAKLALGLRTAADMAEVVGVLVDAGLVEVVSLPRPGGGRPRRVIRAKDAKDAKAPPPMRTREQESVA